MITVSLCMIVKNEEKVLERCLDSVADLVDEIIIVDTGSSDGTKSIAAKYTDKIYDFKWVDDFSAARNFSFSKASMDYIYVADADEYIDEKNREQFKILKAVMLPEVEIVQMHYITRLEFNTVQNSKDELRPKLFKRLREFVWIDPIHETVRLDPVVFDSDIEIMHLPQGFHGKRDFSIFEKAYKRDGRLSERIITMYAKELLKCGEISDICKSLPVFAKEKDGEPILETWEAILVYARYFRLTGDDLHLRKLIEEVSGDMLCSELCYEVAELNLSDGKYDEAIKWFKDAAYTYSPILDVESGGKASLLGLSECYKCIGDTAMEIKYSEEAKQWQLPDCT